MKIDWWKILLVSGVVIALAIMTRNGESVPSNNPARIAAQAAKDEAFLVELMKSDALFKSEYEPEHFGIGIVREVVKTVKGVTLVRVTSENGADPKNSHQVITGAVAIGEGWKEGDACKIVFVSHFFREGNMKDNSCVAIKVGQQEGR